MKVPIKLFISHAHRDVDIAEQLVTALELAMHIPGGAIRCTAVPGYKLDLGSMPPEVLRRELASAESVVAILTPYSLASQWVLFELGATWSQAKQVIPLLGGALKDEDIPGPFRGAVGGHLANASALAQFLDQVTNTLGWPVKNSLAARNKLDQLAAYVANKSFIDDDVEKELKASFAAKRSRIGQKQGTIIDYIANNVGQRPYIPQNELNEQFDRMGTPLHYRLEHLRYLGFLTRQQIGTKNDNPVFGWMLSDKYKAELGL